MSNLEDLMKQAEQRVNASQEHKDNSAKMKAQQEESERLQSFQTLVSKYLPNLVRSVDVQYSLANKEPRASFEVDGTQFEIRERMSADQRGSRDELILASPNGKQHGIVELPPRHMRKLPTTNDFEDVILVALKKALGK